MKITRHGAVGIAVSAAALALGGCRQPPEGWTPVLEMTSTAIVEEETGAALERVAEARALVERGDPGASEALATAEDALRRLHEVYLPAYRARALAYDAYRRYLLDRDEAAAEDLQEIEELLLRVGEGATPPLLGELEELETLTARARMEVGATSPDAPTALRRLAEALERFVVKRDLWD